MTNNIPHKDRLQIEKEVHLLDYLHVIQRRWCIALVVFLLVFVGVAVKTYLQIPVYQSSATLRVGYKQQASEEVLQQNPENRCVRSHFKTTFIVGIYMRLGAVYK